MKTPALTTVIGHLLTALETMHKYTPVLAAQESLAAARAAFDKETAVEHPEDAPIGDPPPAPEPVKEPEPESEPGGKAAKGKR